jgi:N-methylhydantoinase A
VQLRLQAVGATRKPELPRRKATPGLTAACPLTVRPICFGEWRETPVYRRGGLVSGQRFDGPALLLQEDTTTLVPPGWDGAVDAWGNLILSVT